ncbi:MAG: hypothetical protein IPK22_04010 [Verrucomicrobiaceae bacterium]|nr:hypothetical protein [Verrucomicrobiaceae bacterium]
MALRKGKPPLALEKDIDEGREQLARLEKPAQNQGLDTTGNATDRAREEKELEDAAHELGRLVVCCCRAFGDEAGAASYDLPISGWRRMRDENLLQTARDLEAKADELAATPKGGHHEARDSTPQHPAGAGRARR